MFPIFPNGDKPSFFQTVKDCRKKQYILLARFIYLEKNIHIFRHVISSSDQSTCVYILVWIQIWICSVLYKILSLLAGDLLLFVRLKPAHIFKKMFHCGSASCFAEGIGLNFFISSLPSWSFNCPEGRLDGLMITEGKKCL